MATRKRSRKTAFVPRLLVRTAIAGVVPACALVGCGGGVSTGSDGGGSDADTDVMADGVADVFHGVAAVAYPAYESGIPDVRDTGATDTGAKDTGIDVFHGVAAVAYPAYEAGKG